MLAVENKKIFHLYNASTGKNYMFNELEKILNTYLNKSIMPDYI